MNPNACDLQKTALIEALLTVPHANRAGEWRGHFMEHVVDACLAATDPGIIAGPDGMPYIGLRMPEPGKPFTAVWIAELLPAMLRQGMGAVFNPVEGGRPDWVFSYGDLVTLKVAGHFGGVIAQAREQTVQPGSSVLIAAPSEAIYPRIARDALRTFLVDRCQLTDPRLMLVSEPGGFQALAFNVFAEEYAKEDFDWLMRMLQWHLPEHLPLVVPGRNSFDEEDYLPL